MTREGIQVESEMPPDEIDELNEYWTNFELWHRLNLTLKWARLYGGAVAAIIIDGQDPSTELRLDSIRKGQFAGLIVLDRWMLWPHQELVKAPGRNFGKPAMYEVVADARAIPRMRIHHSRCIRFDGADLPYWQRMAENEWSLSVIEPMWDRMIAFDSATQGAAQLIYKAHLRVLKLPQYRELIATGGTMLGAVHQMISMIRMMQTNEGMTVIDAEDEYQVNSYAFGGLSDMMIQFGQQVSGASDVPMTRLFGQSPAGMNATGESDLRNYYDGIKSRQEFGLRPIIKQLLDITHRSLRGRPLPAGFNFSFKPLWQMQEVEKAGIAAQTAQTISTYIESGVFTLPIAMKEVRQSSRITGLGSNLTDEDIEQAEMAPPTPPGGIEAEGGGVPGEPPSPPVAGQPGGQPEAEQPVPTPQLTPHQPARPQDGALGEPGGILDLSRHRAMRRLAHEGNAADDVPPAKSNAAITQANVNLGTGVHARANLPEGVVVNFVPDRRSITDIGGLQCVVETAKGEQRTGYGWSVNMPAHYGYISGTSSAEGPTEQFDCFIGDNPQAEKCWLIEQQNPEQNCSTSIKRCSASMIARKLWPRTWRRSMMVAAESA
jgi:hypothetical protein